MFAINLAGLGLANSVSAVHGIEHPELIIYYIDQSLGWQAWSPSKVTKVRAVTHRQAGRKNNTPSSVIVLWTPDFSESNCCR